MMLNDTNLLAKKPWKCPTCNRQVETPFCGSCGEQPLSSRHLTMYDLLIQLTTQLSNVDSKLLRSLRWLIIRPGVLTIAYVQGRRRSFVGPLQLFLLANVLFITVQSFSRTNVFSSTLSSHLNHQDWSALAQTLVDKHLENISMSLAAYEPLFNQAAEFYAKSLIVLMVLVFSTLLPIAYYGSGRPFAAHVVFSLHLYAFLLTLFCLSLIVAMLDKAVGGAGLESGAIDKLLSILNLTICAAYIYRASLKVYGDRGTTGIVKASILALVVGGLVLGYRFIVFLITLYAT
jgi:hypothetical protein